MSSVSPSSRRILIVDDEASNVSILSQALEKEGYLTTSASDGKEALHKIKAWKPHLVLLDVNMPNLDGIAALKTLRAQKIESYVSVIFITGNSRVDEIALGLDSGADDYIVKPFRLQELLARVRTQLRIKDLNDQLTRANQRLAGLVEIDDLTGLFNMRSTYEKIDNELSRGRRYKKPLSCIMLDLDFFKRANDEHDHLFGSFVIVEVGQLIKECIRSVDIGVRYGGDEFLIVLPETDEAGAIRVAERVRNQIFQKTFIQGSHTMKLTASLGVATGTPDLNMDAREFVRMADKALLKAKELGRNRVVTFSPSGK